jgi:hypothetical protein
VSFRLGLIALVQGLATAMAAAQSLDVVVSVPEQKLYVFNEAGESIRAYRVSTSARGLGDGRGTYATPLGKLEVASKIGAGAAIGTVFKSGRRTGEICAVNAKGRDPIVTRILHLRGLEKSNAQAFSRCIYIHGTPDERRIGKPVSYGCIRMKSTDVVELFDMVNLGTQIEITQEKVSGVFGGIARRPSRLAPVAAGAPEPVKAEALAGRSELPKSGPDQSTRIAMSTKRSEPMRETKVTRGAGEHVKLLETSGLTINFGGGFEEASDRPR